MNLVMCLGENVLHQPIQFGEHEVTDTDQIFAVVHHRGLV